MKNYTKNEIIKLLKHENTKMGRCIKLFSYKNSFNKEVYENIANDTIPITKGLLQQELIKCDKVKPYEPEVYKRITEIMRNMIIRYTEYIDYLNSIVVDEDDNNFRLDYYHVYYGNKHVRFAKIGEKKE